MSQENEGLQMDEIKSVYWPKTWHVFASSEQFSHLLVYVELTQKPTVPEKKSWEIFVNVQKRSRCIPTMVKTLQN